MSGGNCYIYISETHAKLFKIPFCVLCILKPLTFLKINEEGMIVFDVEEVFLDKFQIVPI